MTDTHAQHVKLWLTCPTEWSLIRLRAHMVGWRMEYCWRRFALFQKPWQRAQQFLRLSAWKCNSHVRMQMQCNYATWFLTTSSHTSMLDKLRFKFYFICLKMKKRFHHYSYHNEKIKPWSHLINIDEWRTRGRLSSLFLEGLRVISLQLKFELFSCEWGHHSYKENSL